MRPFASPLSRAQPRSPTTYGSVFSEPPATSQIVEARVATQRSPPMRYRARGTAVPNECGSVAERADARFSGLCPYVRASETVQGFGHLVVGYVAV